MPIMIDSYWIIESSIIDKLYIFNQNWSNKKAVQSIVLSMEDLVWVSLLTTINGDVSWGGISIQ